MERPYYLLALPLLLTMVIIIAATIPGTMLPHWLRHNFDKTLHTLAYAILSLSWLFALRPFIPSNTAAIGLTFCLCLLLGLGLEWLQEIIPRRRMDPLDLRADLIGVLIVCAGWWLSQQLRRLWQARS